MKEISIIRSTMCRLCLSSDVTLLDIFQFSSKMKNRVADVIMERAAVQITRDDRMPNFVCQSCYTQLEKAHQFLMLIEESDRELRRRLQQFYASDKPIKIECSVQPSENHLDIAKCDPLEIHDGFGMDLGWKESAPANFIQENNEEMSLKSEIKVELIDDNLFLTTEWETGSEDISSNMDGSEDSKIDTAEMAVNWKGKLHKNNTITDICIEETSLKSEQMDYNSLILTESIDDTVNSSTNADKNEICCEDTKINIGYASENSRFSHSSSLNKHKPMHTGEKPYQCDLCNRRFSQSSELNTHRSMHTDEKPYQCNFCNKRFSQSCNLNEHKFTHTGEKPYQCDLCNKCFCKSSHLKRHRRIHTGERPYQCDICKKCFAQSSTLISHTRRHTGKKPYQCNICNKCFSQSSALKQHKRMHTGEKPYRCDLNSKRSSDLFTHKRMSTGEKSYQCDFCNKRFSQICNLNKHKFTHTGEKPYQCDLCNKCFYTPSHLKRHRRIHTGERPYQCDICKKCFAQSSNLNTHKRMHTGEKPYQCDICNTCFTQLSNLNAHKLKHTGEKP